MEEIKVGEYVRTESGNFYKVNKIKYDKNINFYTLHFEGEKFWAPFYSEEEIKELKHNKNLLELIELGDFINGKMCIDIEHYTRDDETKGINFVCVGGSVLKENIKSIVTHEQFAQIEYKVEE